MSDLEGYAVNRKDLAEVLADLDRPVPCDSVHETQGTGPAGGVSRERTAGRRE